MNWGMRVMVWGLVLIVLVIVSNSLPRGERELHLFFALCIVGWMIGTFIWIVRALFRFVVR